MAGTDFETLEESRRRVREAARRALVGASRGGALPESVLTAIADGRGERATVAATCRETLGERPVMDLVLFDTDRISDYVFESSRPPVMTGASTILRDLNNSIAAKYEHAVLYSGGGEGMLLLPAGAGEGACREIEAAYERQTAGALGVTTGWIALRPEEMLPSGSVEESPNEGIRLVSGTPAVLSRLRDRVRRKKDERLPAWSAVPGGRQRCVSCRDREGSQPISQYRESEQGLLCAPCARRWEEGRGQIKGLSFEGLAATFSPAQGGEADRGARAKASYIGFLYADGNGMGQLFGRLGSLAELRFLSGAVRGIFARAEERARERAEALAPKQSRKRESPLFLSFLGGGDEVIWIMPAPLAVDAACELAGWVESESSEVAGLSALLGRAGLRSLTVGTGVVLCDHKYPVRYQHALAQALQKNAKRQFFAPAQKVMRSAVDFEVLTDASPLAEDLEAARRLSYRTQEPTFLRTCRPYTAPYFKRLVERAQKAQEAGVARSQLHALLAGSAEGERIFLNYVRYQIARQPAGTRYRAWLAAFDVDSTKQKAVERFFTGKVAEEGVVTGERGTWVADAVQLAPFVESLPMGL